MGLRDFLIRYSNDTFLLLAFRVFYFGLFYQFIMLTLLVRGIGLLDLLFDHINCVQSILINILLKCAKIRNKLIRKIKESLIQLLVLLTALAFFKSNLSSSI